MFISLLCHLTPNGQPSACVTHSAQGLALWSHSYFSVFLPLCLGYSNAPVEAGVLIVSGLWVSFFFCFLSEVNNKKKHCHNVKWQNLREGHLSHKRTHNMIWILVDCVLVENKLTTTTWNWRPNGKQVDHFTFLFCFWYWYISIYFNIFYIY